MEKILFFLEISLRLQAYFSRLKQSHLVQSVENVSFHKKTERKLSSVLDKTDKDLLSLLRFTCI